MTLLSRSDPSLDSASRWREVLSPGRCLGPGARTDSVEPGARMDGFAPGARTDSLEPGDGTDGFAPGARPDCL